MADTRSIILREWNEEPLGTQNFKLTTKFTDLGTPDTSKNIYGFYCNISQDLTIEKLAGTNPFSESFNSAAYSFSFFYRGNPSTTWNLLGIVENSFKSKNDINLQNKLNNVYYMQHTVPVVNIQLRIISNYINAGFGINDFGLIYRVLRDTSVEKNDED